MSTLITRKDYIAFSGRQDEDQCGEDSLMDPLNRQA